MDTVGALLILFGLMALVAGLILFLPVTKFKPRRSTAKRLAIGGLIAVIVGTIVMPTPAAKPDAAETPTRSRLTAPVPTAPTAQIDDRAEEKTALMNNYRQMVSLTRSCDPAIGEVGKAAKSGNMVTLYTAAKDGQSRCQDAWMAITNMSAASGDKEADAIKTCGSAYFLRQRAMETAMAIADGDTKPSNVVSFQDDLKGGEAGVMMCVVKWMEAADALGIKPEQMTSAAKS